MKKLLLMTSVILLPFVGSAQKIIKGEYFFDTDPGIGNGTAISITTPADSVDVNFSASVSSLSYGLHNLYVRMLNDSGVWSMAENRLVNIYKASANNAIVASEYYFDTDPGIGLGTSVSVGTVGDSVEFSSTISVSALAAGLHNLYFRTKNSDGVWSLSENRLVNVYKASANTNIVSAEYFFDTDPGVGLGNVLATGAASDSVDFSSIIPSGSISLGLHNLYIRTKNSDGVWSLSENRLVNVYKSTVNNQIVWSEYFFNTDPGVGLGVGSPVPVPGDSVEFITSAPVSSLPLGTNMVYERTKNSDGVWSLTEGRNFYICNVLADASFSVLNSCQDSVTQFVNTTTGYDGSTIFTWDFGDGSPSSNSFNVSHQYSVYGAHTVTLIADNGPQCRDTAVVNISVDTHASGSGALIGPSTFCVNAPSQLHATINNATGVSWVDSDFGVKSTDTSFYPKITDQYLLYIYTGCDTVVAGPFNVIVNPLPDTAINISGITSAAACANQNGINYSIAPLANATGYSWTLPPLATIVGNADTNAIVVDYSPYSISGNITVNGVNACGAGVAAVLPINYKPIPVVEICGATVDSASQYTQIFWEKPLESYVSGYVIFKEIGTVFTALDTVSNAVFSSYLDSSSTPTLNAETYKIGTLDSCGNVASISGAYQHQTIHLYGYIGWQGVAKLYWNDYVGVNDPLRYYRVLRDSTGSGPFNDTLATNLAPGTLNYTDQTAASHVICRYVIEMIYHSDCTPSARLMANKSSSRSNIANKSSFVPDALTEDILKAEIVIYPNPAKDKVNVVLNGKHENTSVRICDLLGQQITSKEIKSSNEIQTRTELSLDGISPGIYFITVENKKAKKVIKFQVQ